MEKETLKSIFNFIEEKEAHKTPFLWKLINDEPFTEDELNIKGGLDLSETVITSLPNGLKIGGELDLIDCPNLISLPEDLKVGGDLFLYECKNLTSLPKGLQVGLELYIGKTTLTNYSDKELREMIKPGYINGKIIR
jgi:hypothetical protein